MTPAQEHERDLQRQRDLVALSIARSLSAVMSTLTDVYPLQTLRHRVSYEQGALQENAAYLSKLLGRT